MLDLVKTFDKLVGKGLYPLYVLFFDLEESVSYLTFPLGYNMDTWSILFYRFLRVLFYILELLELFFV